MLHITQRNSSNMASNFLLPTMEEQINDLDVKFKLACNQLRLLNSRISIVQKRYDRANSQQKRSFRYSIRIQLCVLEGTRNMYYEYASKLADTLDLLRSRMGYIIVGGVLSDEEERYGDMDIDS